MPLRAKHLEEDLLAFDFDQTSWEILKSNYREMNLIMPCCSAKAIPKSSKLGNFYFSHSSKGNCNSVSESQEHIYIKGLVAKTVKEIGWEVKTEWQGGTPTGEEWIADVFCLKGNAKVAIEIQLSRQTEVETLSRQNRYKLSGVRCAWIASSEKFDINFIFPNKETPFFLISKPTVGTIPVVESFKMPVTDFVANLLSGNIRWECNPPEK